MQVKKQAERIRERLKVKGKVQESRLTGPEKAGRKGLPKQKTGRESDNMADNRGIVSHEVGERGRRRQDQRKTKSKRKGTGKQADRTREWPTTEGQVSGGGWQEKGSCESRGAG